MDIKQKTNAYFNLIGCWARLYGVQKMGKVQAKTGDSMAKYFLPNQFHNIIDKKNIQCAIQKKIVEITHKMYMTNVRVDKVNK